MFSLVLNLDVHQGLFYCTHSTGKREILLVFFSDLCMWGTSLWLMFTQQFMDELFLFAVANFPPTQMLANRCRCMLREREIERERGRKKKLRFPAYSSEECRIICHGINVDSGKDNNNSLNAISEYS